MFRILALFTLTSYLVAAVNADIKTMVADLAKLNTDQRNMDFQSSLGCTRFVHYLVKYYGFPFDHMSPDTSKAYTVLNLALDELQLQQDKDKALNLVIWRLNSCKEYKQFASVEPFPEHALSKAGEDCTTQHKSIAELTAEIELSSSRLAECSTQQATVQSALDDWKQKSEKFQAGLDSLKAQHSALKEHAKNVDDYAEGVLATFQQTNKAIANAQEKAKSEAEEETEALSNLSATIESQANELGNVREAKPSTIDLETNASSSH